CTRSSVASPPGTSASWRCHPGSRQWASRGARSSAPPPGRRLSRSSRPRSRWPCPWPSAPSLPAPTATRRRRDRARILRPPSCFAGSSSSTAPGRQENGDFRSIRDLLEQIVAGLVVFLLIEFLHLVLIAVHESGDHVVKRGVVPLDPLASLPRIGGQHRGRRWRRFVVLQGVRLEVLRAVGSDRRDTLLLRPDDAAVRHVLVDVRLSVFVEAPRHGARRRRCAATTPRLHEDLVGGEDRLAPPVSDAAAFHSLAEPSRIHAAVEARAAHELGPSVGVTPRFHRARGNRPLCRASPPGRARRFTVR